MKIIGFVILCLLFLFPTFHAANTVISKDIKPLKGTAPYGIEKRPMPSGLVMDELLPKQVGPYTRMSLEKSEHRGVIPTKIEVNADSIYAVYKVGAKEVFVEFSVSSNLQTAQETLVVAARNITGKFPKDPRVGSIGTEPSYMKAVTLNRVRSLAGRAASIIFSASAKGGEADLDAFMEGFPY